MLFRASYDHAVSELFYLQTIRDCVSLRLLLFSPDTPEGGAGFFVEREPSQTRAGTGAEKPVTLGK